MKNITPIEIRKNGETKTATVLDASIIRDDLVSFCKFYWELRTPAVQVEEDLEEGQEPTFINGQILDSGNYSISGVDYNDWDGSNDAAYQKIADAIGVTLL